MATYFLMGLPFIGLVLLFDLVVFKTRVVATKQCWMVMAIMLSLTAIFNQLLTGLPIVIYNEAQIMNIKLGYIPVEDFMYTFAAVIGLGSAERFYEQRKR